MKYQVIIEGRTLDLELLHDRLVQLDDQSLYVDLEQLGGPPLYSLMLDDAEYIVFVEKGQNEYRVEVRGQIYRVEVEKQRPELAARQAELARCDQECVDICAPLAGCLLSLPVKIGQAVEAGQVVAVVDSMKMKMSLTAPLAGVVEIVHRLPGHDVGQGDKLVSLGVGRG